MKIKYALNTFQGFLFKDAKQTAHNQQHPQPFQMDLSSGSGSIPGWLAAFGSSVQLASFHSAFPTIGVGTFADRFE
jgi:hypothetical protein